MKIPYLYCIDIFVNVITVLVGGFRYKSLPRSLRFLEWFILAAVVNTIIMLTLGFYHIHNLWTMHFFTLIELTFVVAIYLSWMQRRRHKLVLLCCLVGFWVLWVISKFSFEPLSLADSWTSLISKVLQIAFSTYLLIDIVKESEIVWTNDPRLWIVTGILIYASGSLFLFALFNKMLEISPDHLKMVWSLNWILTIVSNLLFIRGFLCKQ